MEHNTQTTPSTLDIKTLIQLLMEDEMPHARILSLIARECNMPEDTFAKRMTPEAPVVKSRKTIRWDDAALDRLATMWQNGEKPRHIAAEFGCSTQTIYQRVSVLRTTRTDIQPRKFHGTRKQSETV